MLQRILFLLSVLTLVAGPNAGAAGLPTSLDIGSILPASAAAQIVKVFGIMNNHRPFHGAVPLGNAVDLGAEVSLVHLPENFAQSLTDAGLLNDASKFTLGALPTIKAHLHKGIGKSAEIGASALYFRGNKLWGLDFKYAFLVPEEGMTWSFRFGYAETDIDLSRFGMKGVPINIGGVDVGQGSLILKTRTLTPQILGSVKMDFTEPYVGVGLEYTTGQVTVMADVPALGKPQELATPQYSATQITCFTGVTFRVPEVGLHLTLEGGYGSLGMSYLGVMTGLAF